MRVEAATFAISILLLPLLTHFTLASPVLELDRLKFTPFERMTVTVRDPNLNKDNENTETVRVTLSGSAQSATLTLRETGRGTGVFQTEVKFTPDPSKYPGDVQVRRDDGITITYRGDADNLLMQSAFIEYHLGTATFDKPSYQLTEEAVLRVTDPDGSTSPDAQDSVSVKVWSDTDTLGVNLSLLETSSGSGIFEESVFFTQTEISSGNMLKVSDGDSVTLSYVDNTLPANATLSTDGIHTLETKTITANSILGRYLAPIMRAPASEPVLVNTFGESVSQVSVGEQIVIQSEVKNEQSKKQKFAYIMQVKNSDGIGVALSYVTAELPPQDSLKAAQSWLPSVPGKYSIEIFVWESINSPIALSPPRTKNIDVLP